jgi:hypothetical protein
MNNVRYLPLHNKRQPVIHYAYYGDDYGQAQLVNGTGYLFRKEGERKAKLVAYMDPELLLLGRVDLATLQREADEATGGAAWIATHREQEVR